MDEKVLTDLGLSKNETKVYIALLELGLANVGAISNKSKIHRTNVYDALDRLINKGLVAYILKDKTKFFEATEPDNLMNLLKEKESNLKSILPELKLKKELSKSKSEAHVYEGLVAAKNMMGHMLDIGEEILVYGVAREAPDLVGPFLSQFHRKRIKKKIYMPHIYNTNAADRMRILNKMRYTECKMLPQEFDSPVATNICGDEVIMILWQKNALTIQIKNKKIANAYRKYFNFLWKKAEHLD